MQKRSSAFRIKLLIKNWASSTVPCKLHIIQFLHFPVSISHY